MVGSFGIAGDLGADHPRGIGIFGRTMDPANGMIVQFFHRQGTG